MQRAQALRRQKKDAEAWKILLAEPAEASMLVKPDGWWEERRANAYAALKAGKPKTAYELVRNPGALSVNAAKDASFLAGWLALRHLGDAKLALGHFQALAEVADGPLSHRPRPVLAGAACRRRCATRPRRRSTTQGPRPTSTPSTASWPASSSMPARAS